MLHWHLEMHLIDELDMARHSLYRLTALAWFPQEHGEVVRARGKSFRCIHCGLFIPAEQ